MVKLTLGRAMLIGATSYDAGAVADVEESRAAELVAEGHATFVGEPSPELEARVAELRSVHASLVGTPPRPRPLRHLPG